ncbi:MAG: hypothetical protein ABI488_13220 [Polyangiaceae bacterium]
MKIRCQHSLPLLAALAFSSATAHAQSSDSAVAQALFDRAKQLMAAGHVAEACPKLEESQRLDPRSGTLINLASCYEQTARLASAWTTYIEAATSAKASGNSAREAVARQRAAALAPRVSKLTITVAPALKSMAGLEITRDGAVVREPEWGLALPANPGEHEVAAKAPGHASFETKVQVTVEGSTTTVSVPELAVQAPPRVTLAVPTEPAPTEPASSASHGRGTTTRTIALLVGGVGVVGVGLGAAFGLSSKSKHDQAAKDCNGPACPNKGALSGANAAQTDGNISTVMMIVGGVGLAAGVTLWLSAPKESTASAQVGLGLGTLQVKGVF